MVTIRTELRGRALLQDAALNKGTAFSLDERAALGLHGLLPPSVEAIDQQLARVHEGYERHTHDLDRHIFLRNLQDTNEVLFYRYLTAHLPSLLPIVYTPTVGDACQRFSHIYRRPHGLFIDARQVDDLDAQLAAGGDDVRVIVVTDGERILGLGDQGLGGMGIPIGKLSLYTAVGGIDPRCTLPVLLDVGTNNPALLDDPLYLGVRQERLVGQDYLDVVDRFVDAVAARWPGVLLQWEDFAQHHATELLVRHRDRILSFNDDIQGTAAVVLAAVHVGVGIAGNDLTTARVVIVGAGSAATGIAGMLVGSGLPVANLFLVNSRGLLHDHRTDIAPHQTPYVQQWDAVAAWANHEGPTRLEDVVAAARPTILIGVSGQPGVFTEPLIRSLLAWSERPIVLPLSNPTSRAEATAADVLNWTAGRALVATGSPSGDVVVAGRRHIVSQSNNLHVFPGLGAGALAARATKVTDGMLRAAAGALAHRGAQRTGDAMGGLLPPVAEALATSSAIALAVARAARDDAVGDQVDDDSLAARITAERWSPAYPEIRGRR